MARAGGRRRRRLGGGPPATYRHLAARDGLERSVLDRRLAGLSTHRDRAAAEPGGGEVGASKRATGRSSLAHVIVRTCEALADLMPRGLHDVRLAELKLDDIEPRERTQVVALDATAEGVRIPCGAASVRKERNEREHLAEREMAATASTTEEAAAVVPA